MNQIEENSLLALIRESLTSNGQPTIISINVHATGQYIAHVDQYYQQGNFVEAEEVKETDIPDVLKTEPARQILDKLMKAGMLTEDWQPVDLSKPEQALLAKMISDRLDISDVWQVFGALWHVRTETLRTYFNRALDQRRSLDFQEKVKNILD